jgi:hypothetical protein
VSFKFFHSGGFDFGHLVCDAAPLFEGFPTFRTDLLPLVFKGQADRVFCKVGTDFFLFLFRFVSSFKVPQWVTMLSLISNYLKK